MSRSRIAVAACAVALLCAPVLPSQADEVAPAPDPVGVPAPDPTVGQIPTLGAEVPATPPPTTGEVAAVVRSEDGGVQVTTAPDAAALAERTAGDTVLAVDTPGKRYAMALPADDAGRDLQWGLSRMQAEDLWQRTNGSGITVAVLDTGVKASHPDLKGKVMAGFNAITNKAGARKDNNGHGTFLAGMIAGKADGKGVVGIAPGARIMPVKVLDTDGIGDSDDIARGIIWAVDNGADVINMSFGADTANKVESEAIDYARGAGVTLVAAAGNQGFPEAMYPANYPGVLGVGSVDVDNKRAAFSNSGPHVDVVAPGQGILSTFTKRPYTWTSGTSMSTAYVSGIAALAMSYSPGAGGEPLAQQISATAIDLGPAGKDKDYGDGLVDPATLIEQLGAGRAPGMPRDIAASGAGNTLTLTFTPPAGTNYFVQFAKGQAPAGITSGYRIGQGAGTGQPVTITLNGKKPKARYGFAVFTQGPTGTSRAVAGVRPGKWALTGSKEVPRNSRQKLQVGVKVKGFGWVGGYAMQLTTQEGGAKQKVRRFIASSDGPETYAIRNLRWNFNYQVTLVAPGFWNAAQPAMAQWISTDVTAKGGGRITGRVTPNHAASEVQLQRKAGKGWKTIATTQTNKAGKYAFKGASGSLRVYAPADLWRGPASREL